MAVGNVVAEDRGAPRTTRRWLPWTVWLPAVLIALGGVIRIRQWVGGRSLWLDEAMVLFNNNVVPKWKAKGAYMDGGLQYYYSIDGLTRLHHRTGNAEILKLLREGCAGDFSDRYGEWRIHLSNLYAYVGLVDRNPQHVAQAVELFNAYVPAAPSPPCYRDSGAWTKETCKTLRNGHILQYVRWKMAR